MTIILATSLALGAQAADHEVHITSSGFEPAFVSIQLGDTVTWLNDDSSGTPYHTTECATYPWHSPRLYLQYQAYLVFTRAGVFVYHCGYSGFTGTIEVIDPSEPVTVPVLSNPRRLADGRFQCSIGNSTVGKTNIIQAAPSLATGLWTNIQTNVVTDTSPYTFTDATSVGQTMKFYRVKVLP